MFGSLNMHRNHFRLGKGIICIDSINELIAEGRIKITIPDVSRIPEKARDLFTTDKTYPVDRFEVKHPRSDHDAPRLIIHVQGDDEIIETIDNECNGVFVFTSEDFEHFHAKMEEDRRKEAEDELVKRKDTLLECLKNLASSTEDLEPGDITVYRTDILTKDGLNDLTNRPMVVLKMDYRIDKNQVNPHPNVCRFVVIAFHDDSGNLLFDSVPIYDLKKIGKVPDELLGELRTFSNTHLK